MGFGMRLPKLGRGLLFAAAACGGGGGQQSTITADVACDAWSKAVCQRQGDCDRPLLQQFYGTEDDCVRILKRICPRDFGLPGTKDSPAATAACADVIPTVSCDDFDHDTDYCGINFGTLKNGMPCNGGGQCATGFCRIPDTGGCGTCDTTSARGGPCGANDDCGADLGCLVDAAGKGTCVTAVGLGQSCNVEDVVCQSTLFCDPTGSCQVPGKENDPCTVPDSCALEAGLRCGTDGFCHPQPVASAGESCASVGGIEPICLGGACDLDASKCVAPLKLGSACPTTGFPFCEIGLACVAGMCSDVIEPICR